jgi:hypothetical protein
MGFCFMACAADVALRQFQTVFKDAPQLASIFLAWAKQEVER